jgi:1-acyl-sn-glycerol-3-phosphate acyltransferase
MHDYLMRPEALPTWGQRTALRMLNLIGWNVYFKPLPGPHGIAVVYPHTSNWDFFVGLLAKWAVGVQFRWLAKDSLFRGPMGVLMRYWGGVAVDRSAPAGRDPAPGADMHAIKLVLAGDHAGRHARLPPHWKSGFYRIALAADVPVLLVSIDYGKKIIDVTHTLTLTGDEAADMAAIAQVYDGVRALHPKTRRRSAWPSRDRLPTTPASRRSSDDARKQANACRADRGAGHAAHALPRQRAGQHHQRARGQQAGAARHPRQFLPVRQPVQEGASAHDDARHLRRQALLQAGRACDECPQQQHRRSDRRLQHGQMRVRQRRTGRAQRHRHQECGRQHAAVALLAAPQADGQQREQMVEPRQRMQQAGREGAAGMARMRGRRQRDGKDGERGDGMAHAGGRVVVPVHGFPFRRGNHTH